MFSTLVMKFVLFRHAQKGIMPFEDPELTPSGFEQSSNLLNLLNRNALPMPTKIEVSPKRRTSQTLLPIARKAGLTLQITHLLDQRKDDETGVEFRNRVHLYLEQINSLSISEKNVQDVIYACTHYDWLEEAMSLIHCNRDLTGFEFTHWAPTQHLIFEVLNSEWTLTAKGAAK